MTGEGYTQRESPGLRVTTGTYAEVIDDALALVTEGTMQMWQAKRELCALLELPESLIETAIDRRTQGLPSGSHIRLDYPAERLGTISLQSVYGDNGEVVEVRALQMDRVTAITPEMLGMILAGQTTHSNSDGDLITFKLSNGTWVYQLGEYNRPAGGFMLRMIGGHPLTPEC